MNSSHSKDDKTQGMPAGLKVVVLVCALGVFMTGVYQFHAQPAEALATPAKATFVPSQAPAIGAASLVAPFEATAMSADGRSSMASPMAVAQGLGVAQQTIASAPRMYAEPATTTVGDGDNHPPSF